MKKEKKEKKEKKKRLMKIVATTSLPAVNRPNAGTPHARPIIKYTLLENSNFI